MKFFKTHWRAIILSGLILANVALWHALYLREPSEFLSVYFFDIGQGDSILIESPSRGRVLIDGGPNRRVLSELGRVLPFADKRIDVVLSTHPDKDHIGGLPEVISRYQVRVYVEPGVRSDNHVDEELLRRVREKNIPTITGKRGMVLDFGDGVKLTILYPVGDVSGWETNDASIVAKLTYGDQSFLLTGDAGLKAEMDLLAYKDNLKSSLLKVGHHGSRTSTSLPFARAVSPAYAVIPAGKDNTYGHPHREVLEVLNAIGAEVLSTADKGTIRFKTDGRTLQRR